MAYSADEGRPWMLSRLKQLRPESMLDVGTGAGVYADMFRTHFREAHRAGIEAWEPHVAAFGLDRKYDTLLVADARDVDPFPEADVVIFGDVLEHMSEDDAVKLWVRGRNAAQKAVYLSVPIVHYPQGAEGGNPYQIHVVDDYTDQRIRDTFPGIGAHWLGSIVGVYEALAA